MAADDKKNATKNDRKPGSRARPRRPSGQATKTTSPEYPSTGTVAGYVIDDDSDNGLADVRVVLGPAGGGGPLKLADTDDNGRFTFPEIKPGYVTVELHEVPTVLDETPWRPPPPDDGRRSINVVAGQTAQAEAIRLAVALGTVTGFVLDQGTGTGHEGVHVELAPVAGLAGGAAAVQTTGPDGRYLFGEVDPGHHVVRLRPVPAGFQLRSPHINHRDIVVEADELEVVPAFLLQPVPATGTLQGSVRNVEDVSGVEGVEIALEPVEGGDPILAQTDADGDFSRDGLAPGDYRVTLARVPAEAAGRFWQPPSPDGGERNATVEAGEVEVAATILLEALPLAATVTGQVLDVTDGSGLEGVQVALRAAGPGAVPRFAETDAAGQFAFAGVAAGQFVVELAQDPAPVNGQAFEPVVADPEGGRREVTVATGQPDPVPPILVEPERHRIFGRVQTRPGGPGAAFAKVRVLDERGNLLATVEADRNGDYEFRTDQPGRFLIEVEDGARRLQKVELQSDQRLDLVAFEVSGDAVATATQDFAAFPVLTESVSLAQARAPSGAPPSSVGQTVEAALREVLGWRPKPNDPRSFTAALLQSFDRREVEGHTVATWTPRTYAAQVQADLGAITGAQASLYSRARVALDAALPLLDGLYPLDPAADPQDTEAIRSIIRSELTELVTELGVEGGPRISRVDDLLDLLLGPLNDRATVTAQDPVGGQLAQLLDRFGLGEERVETVAEEEVLTNALILVDYVREIDTSWRQRRGVFDPTSLTSPFLGTQLVLLSRSLAVTAESVAEVGFTLDSVFLGAAERLAIRLTFPAADATIGGSNLTDSKNTTVFVAGDTPSILLAELLSWVERVASEEGPRLLQDGGKDGAIALTPVLDKLRALVRASLVTTGTGPNRGLQSPDSVPAGYATARVQRALSELAKYLDDSADLARRIQRSPVRRAIGL